MNPLQVTPRNINSFRQNKASYVARDLEELYGVPPEATWRVLLARGIVKWLAVRRQLIAVKYLWKERVKTAALVIQTIRAFTKNGKRLPGKQIRKLHWTQGYIAGVNDCRRDLKTLCHSPRWQFPNNDWRGIPDEIKMIPNYDLTLRKKLWRTAKRVLGPILCKEETPPEEYLSNVAVNDAAKNLPEGYRRPR